MTARDALPLGVLCCAAAIAVTLISEHRYDVYAHHEESLQQMRALWRGAPLLYDGQPADYPAARNRLLFPALLEGAIAAVPAVTPRQHFVLLRIATAAVMFATLGIVAMARSASIAVAFAAILLHAVCVAIALNYPWTHPWDFLDAAFFFAAAGLSLGAPTRGRRAVLVGLTIVAALNRESAAFSAVVWLVLRGHRTWTVHEAGFAALLAIAGYGTAVAARALSGIALDAQVQAPSLSQLVEYWRLLGWEITMMKFSSPGLPLLLIVALCGSCATLGWHSTVVRRLLLAAVLLFVLSSVWANPYELRAQMPAISLLVLAGVTAMAEIRR